MEKQFTTYEIALKLKLLGFKCKYHFMEYDTEGFLQQKGLLETFELEGIIAPLWQQVIDWFREEHQIYLGVLPYRNNEDGIELCWYYTLVEDDEELPSIFCNADDLGASRDNYESSEEATLQAINKAIKIVKKRQEVNHVY